MAKIIKTDHVGENVKDYGNPNTYGNINWYNHFGKNVSQCLIKLNIHPPSKCYDLAILFLNIYARVYVRTRVHKTLCKRMFIVPLFIVAQLETTQISVNRRIGNQFVEYSY